MSIFQFLTRKSEMVARNEALPGRDQPLPTAERHFVKDTPLEGPFPEGSAKAVFGAGCFWGVERKLWQAPGVISTAVGYAGGYTPNPTYEEVCSGRTGHNEVVEVVYDPAETSFADLVRLFFESHDPTQGMRQGNDVGTQYRSGIYTSDKGEQETAERVRDAYQDALAKAGHSGRITTEIVDGGPFYYAEDYHQQYLAKVPNGYCGVGGTGVACPVGTGVAA